MSAGPHLAHYSVHKREWSGLLGQPAGDEATQLGPLQPARLGPAAHQGGPAVRVEEGCDCLGLAHQVAAAQQAPPGRAHRQTPAVAAKLGQVAVNTKTANEAVEDAVLVPSLPPAAGRVLSLGPTGEEALVPGGSEAGHLPATPHHPRPPQHPAGEHPSKNVAIAVGETAFPHRLPRAVHRSSVDAVVLTDKMSS